MINDLITNHNTSASEKITKVEELVNSVIHQLVKESTVASTPEIAQVQPDKGYHSKHNNNYGNALSNIIIQ